MSVRTRLVRALAALIVGAAGGTLVTTGAAYASACAAGTGVTVVVNSSVGCDANGGGSAASNFRDAGHVLTRATREPGFICKVDGAPSSAPCVNASPGSAFWGLFWSDGKSGDWKFSSSGVDALSVPKGGWVAFKFQNGGERSAPRMTPYTARPVAKPKPKPPSKGSTPATKPTATPTATESPKAKKHDKSAKSEATSSTPSSGATTQPGDDLKSTSQETGGSGSLGWIAGALAVVLIAGMGAVAWRRRTAGGRTP